MRAVLAAALHHGTELYVDEVPWLLPVEGPSSPSEVARWVEDHPECAVLREGWVARSGAAESTRLDRQRRRDRGALYLRCATQLFSGPLAGPRRLALCACVTGSTAYQEPLDGDDVDFMVVTRPGANWVFLCWTWLLLRLHRGDTAPPGADWCFNYVLDARTAEMVFARPGGFHVAREALTARVVFGNAYYAALLASGSWMRRELPRLYAGRATPEFQVHSMGPPAPRAIRALNALLFPLAATYQQLKALVVNAHPRRNGRDHDRFRATTRLAQFALQSEKFDRVTQVYEQNAEGAVRGLQG